MPFADAVAHALVYAALAGYIAGAILLFRIRARSRATIVVDALLRTTLPLILIQLILVAIEFGVPDHPHNWGWTAISAIFAGLAVYMLTPTLFLARTSRSGDGFILFSRTLLGGLHIKLEELYGPGPSRVIAYGIGKKAGEKDAKAILGDHVARPAKWWGAMPYLFRATGLGRLHVKDVQERREVALSIDDCFEAFHGHEGGVPGCDLTRGYFAGLGKALHPDLECQAEETRCASVDGGRTCEFSIRWFEPVLAPRETPAAAARGA